MRTLFLTCCLLLGACQQPAAPADAEADTPGADEAVPAETPLRPATPKPAAATGTWKESGGTIAFLDGESGKTLIRIGCRDGVLDVVLPGVAPIGSEERLSFGGGGELQLLVARSEGAGPVRATGPSPDRMRLDALLEAGPGASYGATAIGPLVPVPGAMALAFAERCLN